MILECCESCNSFSIDSKSGHTVRNTFTRIRENIADLISESFEGIFISNIIEILEISINLIHKLHGKEVSSNKEGEETSGT